jgi:hypothetical protein
MKIELVAAVTATATGAGVAHNKMKFDARKNEL